MLEVFYVSIFVLEFVDSLIGRGWVHLVDLGSGELLSMLCIIRCLQIRILAFSCYSMFFSL
jgi:hypothetical protein